MKAKVSFLAAVAPISEFTASDANTSSGRRRRVVDDGPAHKRFQQAIIMLHAQIMEHRNGNIFHNPIRNSEAPDYREIIKRPMDLKTIKARIRDGSIADVVDFQRDIYLMFANAMMYNGPHSDVYKMAEDVCFSAPLLFLGLLILTDRQCLIARNSSAPSSRLKAWSTGREPERVDFPCAPYVT
jgi:hypothetical protein